MKKLLLLALLTALTAGAALAQKTVVDSMAFGGVIRHYNLYIPKNYITGSSRPLIIHLHGYGSNAMIEQVYTNYMPIADTAGFFIAYPQGSVDGNSNQYWNAGIPGLPASPDDVAFLSALIDTLHERYHIDQRRVYASGLSNGGYMCYQLAWKLANKIAAIASVSGSMAPLEFAKCKPTRAVPIMEIHGTADQTVAYKGSAIATDIDTLMRFWVLSDGCLPISDPVSIPDIDPNDGSNVMYFGWSAELKNTTCELYRIIGGAHVDWPDAGQGNNGDFPASVAIWNFFNRYQLNQSADVKERTSTESSFHFYPNPCSGSIHIADPTSGTITIMDVTGRILLTSAQKEIDVHGLPPGAYLLQYQNEDNKLFVREKLLKF